MRLSPIKHDVGGYTRKDGKRVGKYTRGSRKTPKKRIPPKNKPASNKNKLKTSVTLFFDKGQERHIVQGDSLRDVAFKGLQSLEAAKIPRRMRIKVSQ